MEEISPLFAIQAEKALKSNNPQLAIEICKRGVQFFPDYQIGYVLMAEAYEMMGQTDERDKLLEQIHQQFPKAITTKEIDKRIKVEGSLLNLKSDEDEVIIEITKMEEILESEDNANEELTNEVFSEQNTNWESSVPDISDFEENPEISEESIDELENIEDLIDEAQAVMEDIEETIEDLEDELLNSDDEFIEEMIVDEINSDKDEEIIQEYAEMESEIADLQDFANSNMDPDLIVEFSEELLQIENENLPFHNEKESTTNSDLSDINFNFKDIDLIPGINFLPFKFNSNEITAIYSNISFDNYKQIIELEQNTHLEINDFSNKEIEKFAPNNFETDQAIEENIYNEEEKQGNHLSDDFIPTETLAMIYIKQGKYLNAIDIYQKLMELHPEKMEHYLNKIMLLETEGN